MKCECIVVTKFLSFIPPDFGTGIILCKFLIFETNNVLQSHPTMTFEERSRLCGCLNCSKLSFEASKDLAKNPRIPPRIAMEALISQGSKIPTSDFVTESPRMKKPSKIFLYNEANRDSFSRENKDRANLQRMQWKVAELESLDKEMNGQISKLFSHNLFRSPARARASPRLC